MKKILIGIARFIVNQNDLVATGGAIYACLKIGGEMLGEVMDPLSLIFVILVLRLFYPLIRLVAGIIAKVLKTAAVLYLGHCGQSVDRIGIAVRLKMKAKGVRPDRLPAIMMLH